MSAMTDPIAVAPDEAMDTALAEANLYRIRGLWALAERQCIAVLRKDPNNIHAHSLLGDVFFDQGKYEEAVAWYQMALDLDPNSEPDRQKLQKARDLLAKQQAATRRSTPGSGTGTQKLLGLKPAVWLNVAIAVGVLFLLIIGVLLLYQPLVRRGQAPVQHSGPQGARLEQPPIGTPLPPPKARPLAASPKPVTPPVKPPASQPQEPAQNAAAGSEDMAMMLEQELAAAISQNPDVQVSADVASVRLDPQLQRVTIELIYRGPQTNVADAKSAALMAAMGAARAALRSQDPALQTLDTAAVIVDYLDEQGRPTMLLSATTDRNLVALLGDQYSTEQILTTGFRSITWGPPPPATAAPPSGGYTGQR